jgi:hypothetical protein
MPKLTVSSLEPKSRRKLLSISLLLPGTEVKTGVLVDGVFTGAEVNPGAAVKSDAKVEPGAEDEPKTFIGSVVTWLVIVMIVVVVG